jgi:hypothetical protein
MLLIDITLGTFTNFLRLLHKLEVNFLYSLKHDGLMDHGRRKQRKNVAKFFHLCLEL